MTSFEYTSGIAEIVGKISSKKQMTGGCINTVYLLKAEKGDFICKWNGDNSFPDMLLLEKKGLEHLAKFQLNVPQVFYADKNCILMEYCPNKNSSSEEAGRNLGMLHKNSEGAQKKFGLHYDNYIGSLNQQNTLEENWVDFFWKISYWQAVGYYSKAK